MPRLPTALALLFTLPCAAAPSPPAVALDVGHSLTRPGATSASGVGEFHFNRALALATADALRERGVAPTLIGENGESDGLAERAGRAAGLPLFVSLHHDSVQPHLLAEAHRFSGYSLFVSRKNVDPAASLACARSVARRLKAAGLAPSLHHAEPIPGENRPLADAALGVYWFDDLVVLKSARQPALLLEAGVIVNPREEAWLASAAGRRILAGAIADGVARCLAQAR